MTVMPSPRMVIALVVGLAILVFVIAAASHAIHVFIGGESSYDPQARKEAVISAIVAIVLAAALFLWLFRGCVM